MNVASPKKRAKRVKIDFQTEYHYTCPECVRGDSLNYMPKKGQSIKCPCGVVLIAGDIFENMRPAGKK